MELVIDLQQERENCLFRAILKHLSDKRPVWLFQRQDSPDQG